MESASSGSGRGDNRRNRPGSRIYSLDDLPTIARDILARLAQAGFDVDNEQPRQIMCVAEEAGEFVGAWRRYYGWARRSGTKGDMASELADLIIVTFIAAEVTDIDVMAALESKLEKIYTRGWKDA